MADIMAGVWSLWYFSMAGIMAGLCGVLVWLV